MSSSRIVKSSRLDGHSIRNFSFETLDSGLEAQGAPIGEDGFVPYVAINGPLNFQTDESVVCTETEEYPVDEEAPQVVEELQPCITEDELNARTEESYERGFEEGQRQAERGLSNVFKALRDAIEEIYGLREQIFRHSEEDLLKLSMLVAGKIIQQEVGQDRRILVNVVSAALEKASERDELTIRLNPEDLKLVNLQKQLNLSSLGDEKLLNLKPDDNITSGGCIIETQMGEIDARLEKQLDEIYKRLTEDQGRLIESSRKTGDDREPNA